MRVTGGDSGLCGCVPVASVKHYLTPLFVNTVIARFAKESTLS